MEEDSTQSFGGRLKYALKAAGLTQLEAAKRLGVNKDTLTNYVKGRIPRTDRLNQLAKLCNVSPEWLLWGRGKGPDDKTPDGRDPPRDKHFGQRLSDAIIANGLTLEQLVRELEIPEWELRDMLNGRIPNALTLLRLADRLDVSMRWLLTGQDTQPLGYQEALRLAQEIIQRTFDQLKHIRMPGPAAAFLPDNFTSVHESTSVYGEEKEKGTPQKEAPRPNIRSNRSTKDGDI